MSKTAPTSAAPGTRPSLREACRVWLKLGFISFGGPAGVLALLHTELVERRRWISERRFLHALNYCMTLPGPTAQQLATYVGWLLHGTRGALAAGGLLVLPAFFLMVTLSWLYMAAGHLAAVAGVLDGFKPAVLAVVGFAVVSLGRRTLKNRISVTLALAAFVAMFALGVSFPWIVLGAAILGGLVGWLRPGLFTTGPESGAAEESPAVLADGDPTPAHARPSWVRAGLLVAVFAFLWWYPMHLMTAGPGRSNLFAQMAQFFTQAALFSFGGGYAVLSYVATAAVEHYRWLDAAQMMDGLALGETTPGPLIMVVTFVGFVGGWAPGNNSWLGALLGAFDATYYMFLPSFLFILLGGPFIEAMRGRLRLAAPLTAITAATVGVILNLAVFFGQRVLFPARGGVDWFSTGLAAVALAMLWRFRIGIIPVVIGCGVIGSAAHLAGVR